MAYISNSWHQQLLTIITKILQFTRLLGDFLDKLEEPASIHVGMYGGYLSRRAVFHCLGGLRRTLLDTVPRQNVDDSNEVYLMAQTICVRTVYISHTR